MFEAHVLHLLRTYLGEYVHGLSAEALKISVWSGDVELRDLKLKAEALNSLKLPVIVKAGFVGSISLKVPWQGLGKEPVIVQIDKVFVLAHPVHDGQTMTKEDMEKRFEAKLNQIKEAESATLEAMEKSKQGNSSTGNSWFGSLVATIIGNLKISISNVHIRYEDSVSNPGYPFSSGITLATLAAVTMDEHGNETFDTSGALDKLRKSLHLERLALYHDTKSGPWEIDKGWEDLNPREWIEIFEDGINKPSVSGRMVSKWAKNRKYLVSPINGVLNYHRLGNDERTDPEVPFEKGSLVLSDVSLRITEAQYHDWIKLLEVISRYRTYIEVSHLRPLVPISGAPYMWWRYAAQASMQQKKMCYRFSWERIQYLCHLRRRYIQLYAGALQQLPDVDISEIREIEKDLDSKVILLWRLLAHAKVEYVHSKEAAELKKKTETSWFSVSWLEESEDSSFEDASEELQPSEENLTKEEWKAIHKLLSHQPDKESIPHSGKEKQNMIQFLVTVSVGHAAARIISIDDSEIVCGRFEELHLSTKFKHRSIHCDVLLKYYGLSAPEGSLAKSVCSEQKVNALTASFVHKPVGENVDWRLSATISPCHVTILMESCDRFFEFVKRSSAVSPIVASETANALQMKIEKVTRRAQKQLQMVLEEQSRFALYIDFDAPKVRVPLRTHGSSNQDSHFLLDFGHFTLDTKENQPEEHRQNLYSRFYISGRDITAFFTDYCPDCKKRTSGTSNYRGLHGEPEDKQCDSFYPLIDRCGMAVIIDKIKVPHPSYPATCISVQVPSLSIHLSPARYSRLMELLNILSGTTGTSGGDNLQAELGPWSSIDLSTNARILVWKGIGNSMATWKPCFLILSGQYLYHLESEVSLNYQQYLSMASRQVYEVPSENVGGSEFCVAVSFRGMDNHKALESSSTWVIEFQDVHAKTIWLQGLIKATYKASAPPSVDVLDDGLSDSGTELGESHATTLNTADIVINGALVESKLFLYGKNDLKDAGHLEEVLIVEVLLGGAKVHIIRWEGDMAIKMKLHSLKIKDEFQGRQSMNPQYLVLSVLKNENVDSSTGIFSSHEHEKEKPKESIEDDDNFSDASSDFKSVSDPSFSPHNMDISAMMWEFEGSAGVESPCGSSCERDPVKGISGEIFYASHNESNDFVCVTFSKKSSDSPNYDGIDTQMSFRMSQLEMFFNRPTLVALIGLGGDLSHCNSSSSSSEMTRTSDDISSASGHIKGLLGFGKGRVVFYLSMNIKSVTIFLNKEDGSQLAMFVQESFVLDYKIYPSSLSIEGTLGNLRVCDMWLGSDHCWGWLCNIRNPEVGFSLIKFKFISYSTEDDDYEGYDYSLNGQLSAVRIVFLYRFVTELTAYFTELATPSTEESIKIVDKVGDLEWLVQKREIDGATALKLDLYFDTPIIIIPRNSMSRDSIQFDMGQLRVTNELIWHGCPEKDPSAVHVDVLHVELIGMNMSVGINGCLGKPVIRESHGFDIYVRRSLRDVFKQVPTISIEAKIGVLHSVMSDKEYQIIMDCASMNISEEPRLSPSFRGDSFSIDTTELIADKVNINSHIILSRTVTTVAVELNYALLELCTGTPEALPLAHIVLEDLWVSYRMTKLPEADLYVTIPKFSILDVRPNTKPEMRLMFGSSTDAFRQASTGKFLFSSDKGSIIQRNSGTGDVDVPYSTMFLMDGRWRLLSKSFVLRIQQPRILVVPEFLLALGEFFLPSLKSVTGREENMDTMNDPISRNNCIVLFEPVYKQKDDVVYLSPSRQLVVDSPGVNEYIYDGCGKIIYLTEETEMKEPRPEKAHPIIFIGSGKRLRFVNVKIENGSLLMRCTCLSNDSSYSVCIEDGVDISFLDKSSSDDDKRKYMQKSSDISDSSSCPQSNPSSLQSLTFETQLVSAEFTLYDGTKSYLDESSYGEKLLRVKMDLSFMYASREKDAWIRALLKDLTVEAGSGFIVLHPVDISGSYTFVNDNTNLCVLSTDICVHLSLSAISLVLNLQSQIAKALQFGNTCPVAMCTNYDRLWVSLKGNGIINNLTFWRPQAPSNYVIFGDCVTSRSTPPSQAVMAVNNIYGRVRKPIGFNLIGLMSDIEGFQANDGHSDVEGDCSLWMPIAPPGYMALGCVTNKGNQPPPNHIVYCIRTDLVTSATYSDCIYAVPSNHCFPSGFSIWRLDNDLGSFYAHSSVECPSNYSTCDLSHLLLSNWNCQQPSSKVSSPSSEREQKSDKSKAPSGWDVVRSISKANDCFIPTPNFERIWWDKGSDSRRSVAIWRPVSRAGYGILGDCITDGLEPPTIGIICKDDNPEISSKPVQFTKVAHIVGRDCDEVFFWYPVAPSGYASLGCVVSKTDEAPRINSFCCPRTDLVNQANITEVPVSSSSISSPCWSIWRVENQACTFLAHSDVKKPSSQMAFTIGNSIKEKTQENITAEITLRFFSVTVLDSLCGKMTPVVDTTITNIKLAAHGRAEAMNAVLISSIATSTFNTQLEAWEPLIEPFDGIFKFETYDANMHPPAKIGKRMRLAASNILNINVSAASLETFVQMITSWRRQVELDQKASLLNEEVDSHSRHGEDLLLSALEEDDFPTVIVENKLGCDIYLKSVQHNTDKVDLIHYGDCASLWIPPPRFTDRLNITDESKEAHYYVAVLILEAKGLPMIDDGNGYKVFCALHLVVESQVTNQQKFFPQSARTRSVTPLISRRGDHDEGTVRWNELFIFEVPQKGMSKFEVEVTNLSAKAGKGDVVGTFSYSIGRGANMLKKMPSMGMVQQPYDNQNFVAYPLCRKDKHAEVEYVNDYGHVMVSTCCFERKSAAITQRDSEYKTAYDRDVGFWMALGPEGTWESVRSILPLSVVPKTLQDNVIAMEVIMENGKKRALIRGLVTVVNDSDVTMDVSICHVSSLNTQDSSLGTSRHNIVVEEIFENQSYASSGWIGNDPDLWSTRDFSRSSKEFSEPPLPLGWQWTSTWTIDKSHVQDEEGWAYGPDLQSLKWPPTSSKSCSKSEFDVARRRRWIRTRQKSSEQGIDWFKGDSIAINPGCSTVLPWISAFKDSDQCLQVRPTVSYPNPPYDWGCGVAVGYYTFEDQQFVDQLSLTKQTSLNQGNKAPDFTFKLNELEKKDILMSCLSNGSKQFWLSVGTDASVLQSELNTPVYDWKISINSPLKLENRLPSRAGFTIWENTKDGDSIGRQDGMISSRESVHIYSADLQKPVYLTLFVQGGWVLEKDPVLVLDLSTVERVSSFWMVHQQSKRKLRINVERDFGGSSVAPKTIRFFVPYWIVNDSSLSLAYRLEEIEPKENKTVDSPPSSPSLKTPSPLKRAVSAATFSFRSPTFSLDRGSPFTKRNIQVFEHIDDTSPIPSMLSPQDYAGRSGISMFANQKEVGIAVAVHSSDIYGPGISLLELENKQRVDVKAFSSDGSYYKLSALLKMTSDRTKVVHFQPHTLYINRVGCSICMQQCDTHVMKWIHPADPPKPFALQSYTKIELLRLRVEGYRWSTPFSVSTVGVMRISLKKESETDEMQLRVAVRCGTKHSRYEVVIRPDSTSSPYRIENRSMFLPIHFRQVDGVGDSWQKILPNAAASFYWEDLGRRRLLELLPDGTDPLKSDKYNIDEIFDYHPTPTEDSPTKPLRVTVIKEEKINVVRISDWMPDMDPSAIANTNYSASQNEFPQDSVSTSDCEFHVIVELAELGISIIDHTPEEILYLSVQNLLQTYSTGLGAGISRFKVKMHWIQVDNQLPLTPMPVLLRPQIQRVDENYNILSLCITMQSNGSLDLYVYPHIGFDAPENNPFLINIQEPIIWRLHEMIQHVKLNRLSNSQTTAVSVDPFIEIGVLNISEVRCKISLVMSPSQRPRGVLGFWLSLMTALGNTENMPIRINQRFLENVRMRQSSMISNAVSNMQKDLLGQPLQLLSGVDILGNASSALGNMSKGVAALSMDNTFIQSRQRQENKGVEDFGDVIREGGGALAKGLFRGVTGILTKPLEGAKTSGVEGFVQGVGKGIIGAAAQPMSGVLELLSKTTEGANAVRMKLVAAITSDEQLLRRRLPRVVGGDNLVRPFDDYRAQGQVILQLAESGSFFGQADLFKVRGKFALSDAYEDHFLLPKGKILVVTHRRIMLLQQPSNIMGQGNFSPAQDPCSVLWDVLWGDIVNMELSHGKKDDENGPPSLLIIYILTTSIDPKDLSRTVKCKRETHQALQACSSIERAMSTYGPNISKGILKEVTKPYYSPIGGDYGVEEEGGICSSWSPEPVPESVPQSSIFGRVAE